MWIKIKTHSNRDFNIWNFFFLIVRVFLYLNCIQPLKFAPKARVLSGILKWLLAIFFYYYYFLTLYESLFCTVFSVSCHAITAGPFKWYTDDSEKSWKKTNLVFIDTQQFGATNDKWSNLSYLLCHCWFFFISSLNTPPGTKVKLLGTVQVKNGLLLLDDSKISVLGGVVEHMVEKWELQRVRVDFIMVTQPLQLRGC